MGSDSSAGTSTTVSAITSGLMAAWMNSGVDTQGGTKTSTKRRKGGKKNKYVTKFLLDCSNLSYMKLL